MASPAKGKYELPPRFEIRVLEPRDAPSVSAIFAHSFLFHSPAWSVIYKAERAERCFKFFKAMQYHVETCLASGLSYGAFDREYKLKRPESAATGGALYWDFDNPDVTGEQLLEQMDFPLAHVSLSGDVTQPVDMERYASIFGALPHMRHMRPALASRDVRPEEERKPSTTPGVTILRKGTTTRADYANHGLLRAVTYRMARDYAAMGYRTMQISGAHPAVEHVYMNLPAPFTARLVSSFRMDEYEEEVEGSMVKVFAPADPRVFTIVVSLGQEAQ